ISCRRSDSAARLKNSLRDSCGIFRIRSTSRSRSSGRLMLILADLLIFLPSSYYHPTTNRADVLLNIAVAVLVQEESRLLNVNLRYWRPRASGGNRGKQEDLEWIT